MKARRLLPMLFLAGLSWVIAADPAAITAKPGQQFSITLDSNATTGYHWQLAKPLDETCVKLLTNEYQSAKSRLMGSGGKEVWTFKAVGQGSAAIQLNYVRPWETNVPPVKTTNFQVRVKKTGA